VAGIPLMLARRSSLLLRRAGTLAQGPHRVNTEALLVAAG